MQSTDNIDKQKYEKYGFITYKSSDDFIKIRPSYLATPARRDIAETVKPPDPMFFVTKERYRDSIKMVLKSPSYFYSYYGYNLVRDYIKSYDLTPLQGNYLMILGFHELFFIKDLRYWCLNYESGKKIINYLCAEGYAKKVQVPSGKNTRIKKHAFMLSTLGRNFVEGYEAFYDQKMDEIRNLVDTKSGRTTQPLIAMDKELETIKEKLWNDRILKRKDLDKKISPVTLVPLKKG